MTALTYILSFAFTLGVIVVIHELGHFMVAKAFGVRVVTFSIGFGNRIWGFQRGDTDYRISALPLGGYVRMGGEQLEESTGDPQDFVNKPRWQRVLVYMAGPAMNLVLSLAVMAVLFNIGIFVQALQDLPAQLGRVEAGSAGEKAGLLPGDLIVAVDSEKVDLWKDFAFAVATANGRELLLEVERQGQRREIRLTPTKEKQDGYGEAGLFPNLPPMISDVFAGKPAAVAGFPDRRHHPRGGRPADQRHAAIPRDHREAAGPGARHRGLSPGRDAGRPQGDDPRRWRQRPDRRPAGLLPPPALGRGGGRKLALQPRDGRQDLPGDRQAADGASSISAPGSPGPLEMGKMTGEAAEQGWPTLFLVMAFLSISIGVLNLLPIPLLDGGQIFILLVESVLRRDLPMRFKERFAQVGFMILMVLMATVIFFDLSKLVPS